MLECVSALDLLEDPWYNVRLISGDKILDEAFSGGLLLSNGIFEFAGEAGSGKTQLACQYAISSALPLHYDGLDGGCLIINTEGNSFPYERLRQIMEQRVSKLALVGNDTHDGIINTMMERIMSADITKPDELTPTLDRFTSSINRFHFRLLIIDSIGALYRSDNTDDFEKDKRKTLSHHLHSLAAQLRNINRDYRVGIIVMNQAADVMQDMMCDNFFVAETHGYKCIPAKSAVRSGNRWIRPALGSPWDGCVNTRIVLSNPRGTKTSQYHTDSSISTGSATEHPIDLQKGDSVHLGSTKTNSNPSTPAPTFSVAPYKRYMYLTHSPIQAPVEINYHISNGGVVGETWSTLK